LSSTIEVSESNLKKVWLFNAIFSLILGAILLAWPGKTTIFVAWISLILLAVSAVYHLISVFAAGKPGYLRVTHLFSGLIAAILIYFVFVFGKSETAVTVADSLGVNPLSLGAALLLAFSIGVNWIVSGAVKIFVPLLDKTVANRGLTIFSGALALFAGIFIVAYPVSITLFATITGAFLVILGVVEMFVALKK
jgi:uncharacterized membrane protein HdeD (DUF308 family)